MNIFHRFHTSERAATKIPETGTTTQAPRERVSRFEELPPELHLLISQQLTYPDALSLKHTNRYFYYLVDTGLKLKVDWLIERRSLHLECPNDRCCDLGSDLKFCRGSVRLLMQRRREHFECESRPGLGCLVYGTKSCAHRQQPGFWMKRCLRSRLTIELWWVLMALIPAILACLWAADLTRWQVGCWTKLSRSTNMAMVST